MFKYRKNIRKIKLIKCIWRKLNELNSKKYLVKQKQIAYFSAINYKINLVNLYTHKTQNKIKLIKKK